jgi:hypothetical protein
MSSSKMKPPSILTMIPNSKANSLPDTNTSLPAPTPTRTTRPSSPLPRSPITVSRTPVVDSKKDFDASVVVQKPNTPMRIAPSIEKATLMTNYSEIVNANSVESQLESKKYTILDRIITNEEGVQVNYIKAYDPNGVIVYILMDSIGNLSVSEDELKPMSLVNESKIRVSDKMAASACAGTGICGVALICNDEICMMVRNNDGTTTEKSYQSSTPILKTGDSSISHIIIRMSEIQADPEGTLSRSFEANERVMRAVYHSARETLNRAVSKAKFLEEAIKSFIDNRTKAYESLEKERMMLSAFTSKYYNQFVKGNLDINDENEYSRCSLNLYARNKVFLDLVSITNIFSEEEDEMERTCNAIIQLNNEIVEKHQAIFKKSLEKENVMKL